MNKINWTPNYLHLQILFQFYHFKWEKKKTCLSLEFKETNLNDKIQKGVSWELLWHPTKCFKVLSVFIALQKRREEKRGTLEEAIFVTTWAKYWNYCTKIRKKKKTIGEDFKDEAASSFNNCGCKNKMVIKLKYTR